MSSKYHLLYKLEARPEGITADEVPEGYGACHTGIFISMLYPPDGSYSQLNIPVDGRETRANGGPAELDIKEQFKAWSIWSLALAKQLDPKDGRQMVAQMVAETMARHAAPEINIEAWRKSHGLPNPNE